ncbi:MULTISPECIES: NUDIX domain-containing protein [Streptomyces]|uniref:NUDIX domain-containing protein n=1 Tax=Streptomyces TaxID=1883 RepID=UPI001F51A5B9|nr:MULTISPECIES: NUDIX domain-containing protein [unclassified Streptomyces]
MHATVGALLVRGGREILLIEHRAYGITLQPGGHLDPTDATLVDAAVRELALPTFPAGVCSEAGRDGSAGGLQFLVVGDAVVAAVGGAPTDARRAGYGLPSCQACSASTSQAQTRIHGSGSGMSVSPVCWWTSNSGLEKTERKFKRMSGYVGMPAAPDGSPGP